jgi:hypothetical protein
LFEAFPEAQNAGVDTQAFATHFGQLYRELHQRAVRRIQDPRDAPSAETSGSAGRPLLATAAQALSAEQRSTLLPDCNH